MDGTIVAERLDEIAGCSVDGPGVTRLPWTPEHRAALTHIEGWMEDAGLSVHLDAAGTLIGRSPGGEGKPVLLIGSHQDSVPNGGRFDGIMGVALACLAARRFKATWDALPFAVEILAFADEEGVRFPTALIGPRALAGTLDPDVFELTDRDGLSMGDAMRAFGADPDAALTLRRDPHRVLGYLEVHIEQGPVLEAADRPIGIVTAICGIARFTVTVDGETGHAGTVPMTGRRDALVGAAAIIQEVGARAESTPGIRATVGRITVAPGAVNAIPAHVTFTLEIRATEDAARGAFARDVTRFAEQHCASRNLSVRVAQTYLQRAVPCDRNLSADLAGAAADNGHQTLELMSGATHDASAMADLCPIAMLFIPCRSGVSHRPDEHARPAAMGAAIDVLAGTITRLAARS